MMSIFIWKGWWRGFSSLAALAGLISLTQLLQRQVYQLSTQQSAGT